MTKKFEVIFLDEAIEFINRLDKKSNKVPKSGIEKAEKIRREYFKSKTL